MSPKEREEIVEKRTQDKCDGNFTLTSWGEKEETSEEIDEVRETVGVYGVLEAKGRDC